MTSDFWFKSCTSIFFCYKFQQLVYEEGVVVKLDSLAISPPSPNCTWVGSTHNLLNHYLKNCLMETTNLDKSSSSTLDSVSSERKEGASLSDTNGLISFGILRRHGRFSVSSTSNCNDEASGKLLSCTSCPPVTSGDIQENKKITPITSFGSVQRFELQNKG